MGGGIDPPMEARFRQLAARQPQASPHSRPTRRQPHRALQPVVHLHLTTSDETNVRRFLFSVSISLMARVRGSDRRRQETNDANVEEESACSNGYDFRGL